jgi:integrase
MKTIEVLMKEYHNTYLAETNKSHTLQTRRRRLTKPLDLVSGYQPRHVSPEAIRRSFLAWAEGKSPRTAKSGITELKAFWKWLAEENYITSNPWLDNKELTRLPRLFKGKPHQVKPTHDLHEAIRLYTHLYERARENPRGREAVAFLGLDLGSRVGEILGARPGDVRGRKVVFRGKTGEYERTLSDYAYVVVTAAAAQTPHHERIWLFNNNQICPWLKKLCLQLGLQGLGMHALRRTNATLLAASGVDQNIIQQRLAHLNFQVTEGHYIKPGTLEDANASKVRRLFEAGSVSALNP